MHPCLFVILLSVIFDDVDTSLRENGAPTDVWSTQHPCFDLDYSDDTLLRSLTVSQLQTVLHTHLKPKPV